MSSPDKDLTAFHASTALFRGLKRHIAAGHSLPVNPNANTDDGGPERCFGTFITRFDKNCNEILDSAVLAGLPGIVRILLHDTVSPKGSTLPAAGVKLFPLKPEQVLHTVLYTSKCLQRTAKAKGGEGASHMAEWLAPHKMCAELCCAFLKPFVKSSATAHRILTQGLPIVAAHGVTCVLQQLLHTVTECAPQVTTPALLAKCHKEAMRFGRLDNLLCIEQFQPDAAASNPFAGGNAAVVTCIKKGFPELLGHLLAQAPLHTGYSTPWPQLCKLLEGKRQPSAPHKQILHEILAMPPDLHANGITPAAVLGGACNAPNLAIDSARVVPYYRTCAWGPTSHRAGRRTALLHRAYTAGYLRAPPLSSQGTAALQAAATGGVGSRSSRRRKRRQRKKKLAAAASSD